MRKKICSVVFLIMHALTLSGTSHDYIALTQAIIDIAQKVTCQLPAYQMPEPGAEMVGEQDTLFSRYTLRTILDECSLLLCRNPQALSDLVAPLNACYKQLGLLDKEIPEMNADDQALYRSCCKRLRCLMIKQDLTVNGTMTTHNLNVIGNAYFFNTLAGAVFSYGYLGFANQPSQAPDVSDPVAFDLINSNQGFFLGSADITPHTNLSNPLFVDGVTIPEGVYYFFWRVKGRLLVNDGTQMNPIVFELFSLADNASVPHSKAGSAILTEAISENDGVTACAGGIARFTQTTSIQLRNASAGGVVIPGVDVQVQPDEVIAEMIFIRIKT